MMERRFLGIAIFLSCLFLSAQSQTYDITSYGAKGNGADITKALADAWKAACSSKTASKVVIPAGNFVLREAVLAGPCTSPIELQVAATIKASPDPKSIKTGNEWIMVNHLEHFTLSGNGVFDGLGGAAAWKRSDRCASPESCNKIPTSFAFDYVNHSTITGITSKDSKLMHIVVYHSHNLTMSHVTVSAPEDSPNTDGIHIGRSSQITITDCTIKTGDDCISIGDGSVDIKVTGVNCGPGHGIAVGSLGRYQNELPVEGVHVTHCVLTNTMFGVRIKTWAGSPPGKASDMHFENIDMNNVGTPILIDQVYCPNLPCKVDPPSGIQISKVSFKGIKGTSSTPTVASLVCSKGYPCQNVEIGDINLKYTGKVGKIGSNCTNVKPIFSGVQVPPICQPGSQAS